MNLRRLEQELRTVPDFTRPDPAREQYRTPVNVAAQLLWHAHMDGCIEGRWVLDLGCGTGIFAKGAEALGAREVMGVDVDPDALAIAADQVPGAHFTCEDVDDVETDALQNVETVIMNPPFGAQKGNRNADRRFYEVAMACDPSTIWFLAPTVSETFLSKFALDSEWSIERLQTWEYPLPATMAHHRDEVRTIEVGGYRMAPGA